MNILVKIRANKNVNIEMYKYFSLPRLSFTSCWLGLVPNITNCGMILATGLITYLSILATNERYKHAFPHHYHIWPSTWTAFRNDFFSPFIPWWMPVDVRQGHPKHHINPWVAFSDRWTWFVLFFNPDIIVSTYYVRTYLLIGYKVVETSSISGPPSYVCCHLCRELSQW